MLTDTHCHLDFSQYEKDRSTVLSNAWRAGLERIMVPGIDLMSSRSAILVAESDPRIFAAIGVHPNSAASWNGHTINAFLALRRNPKAIAIGEIGLDYYRKRSPKSLQRQVLQKQLELASSCHLPVIIHTRNASEDDRGCISDLIAILKAWNPGLPFPGVIHSYSGNQAEAESLTELGYFIGVTGPITYKNATELRKVVAAIPLEHLLIETDGPFLTPQPHRGKRNEPAYVQYIAEAISNVQRCSLKSVIEQTSVNAQALFHWKEAEGA